MNTETGFHRSPWRVFFALAGVVFLVEVLVMGLLDRIAISSPLLEALVDGSSLVLFLFPAFYFIVVRPLLRALQEKAEVARELKETTETFQAMVWGATDGMLLVDAEGIIRYANVSAESLLQRPSEKLLGSPLGSPLVSGQVTELDLIRETDAGVAEMRVVDTQWNGESAYLIMLRDVTQIVTIREQLREQSIRDELSGLLNRRGFFSLAQQQLKLARRNGDQVHVYFIDLDGMKPINDQLGHDCGDQALRDAASVIRESFRESDVLGRLGGDEFVSLCIESGSPRQPWAADRIQACVNELNATKDRKYRLSLSVGCVTCDPQAPETIEQLVRRADTAMYAHKQGKRSLRNQIVRQ